MDMSYYINYCTVLLTYHKSSKYKDSLQIIAALFCLIEVEPVQSSNYKERHRLAIINVVSLCGKTSVSGRNY